MSSVELDPDHYRVPTLSKDATVGHRRSPAFVRLLLLRSLCFTDVLRDALLTCLLFCNGVGHVIQQSCETLCDENCLSVSCLVRKIAEKYRETGKPFIANVIDWVCTCSQHAVWSSNS